jgi:uroporphyrinogen-III synthase
VGAQTTARARAAGLDVTLESRDGHLASLVEDLAAEMPPVHPGSDLPILLHAGAEETRGGLERLAEEQRARIEHVAIYRTVPLAPLPDAEREALNVDVALFASPSAVIGLLGRARLPEHALIITIGPSTSAAAREAGLRVPGEAVTRDLLGMLLVVPPGNGP